MSWNPESLTDSHLHVTHLNADEWRKVRDRATHEGVHNYIFVSTDYDEYQKTKIIVEKTDHPYISLGTHPHEAKTYVPSDWEKYFENETYVAVGECGLDYYYDHSPQDVQQKVFHHQLDMAHTHHKPVIVHVRDAFQDAIPFIQEYGKKGVTGVVHCFSGDPAIAKKILDAGWYLGFTGIITFPKKVDTLLAALRTVPMHKILVETDSPYLAPNPYRGKVNEPAYLPFIAKKVAEEKGVDLEAVLHQTTQNVKALFLSARKKNKV